MIDRPAADRRAPHLPFLPSALLEARRPALAIGLGALTAVLPSLMLAALVQWLLPQGEGPDFAMSGAAAIVGLVIFAPVVETLIMGAALLIFLRFMPATAAIIVSAAGWAVAHSLAAPVWGLIVWWPFLIFSTLFVVWRGYSLAAAFAVPASVHALQNLGPALILASGTAG